VQTGALDGQVQAAAARDRDQFLAKQVVVRATHDELVTVNGVTRQVHDPFA